MEREMAVRDRSIQAVRAGILGTISWLASDQWHCVHGLTVLPSAFVVADT